MEDHTLTETDLLSLTILEDGFLFSQKFFDIFKKISKKHLTTTILYAIICFVDEGNTSEKKTEHAIVA